MVDKKRVLLVEDDTDLGEAMEELLEYEGYEVDYIQDPTCVFGLLDKKTFDFIVVDYKMPKMDGLELVRLITDRDITAKIFVISGRPFIEKIFNEAGMENAVTQFIAKPFKCEELLDKLNSFS